MIIEIPTNLFTHHASPMATRCEFQVPTDGQKLRLVDEDGAHGLSSSLVDSIATPVMTAALPLGCQVDLAHLFSSQRSGLPKFKRSTVVPVQSYQVLYKSTCSQSDARLHALDRTTAPKFNMCLASIPLGVAAKTTKGCATTFSNSSQIVTTVKESKGTTMWHLFVLPSTLLLLVLPLLCTCALAIVICAIVIEFSRFFSNSFFHGIVPSSFFQDPVPQVLDDILIAMQDAEATTNAAAATRIRQTSIRMMRVHIDQAQPPRRFVQVLIYLAAAIYHVGYICMMWRYFQMEAHTLELEAHTLNLEAQLEICQASFSFKAFIAKMFSKD